MQNQHLSSLNQTSSHANQAQVTPEQLSAALRAIEARQEKHARRLSETITLEEAVSALNLKATPEEIMAEVQRQEAPKTSLIAAMWLLVAWKIIGFVHLPVWLGAMIEIAFLVLAILLMRSAARVNRLNGRIVAGYWLITLLISIGRALL